MKKCVIAGLLCVCLICGCVQSIPENWQGKIEETSETVTETVTEATTEFEPVIPEPEPTVFIDYDYNLNPEDYQDRIPIRYGEGGEKIIIYGDEVIFYFKLCKKSSTERVTYIDEVIFSVEWGFTTDYYIEYSFNESEWLPDIFVSYKLGQHGSIYYCGYIGFDGSFISLDGETIIDNTEKPLWYGYEDIDAYLATMPLAGDAKLVVRDGNHERIKDIVVYYEDSDETVIFTYELYHSLVRVSPDGTKISCVSSVAIGLYGTLYYYDVITREFTVVNELTVHEESIAAKRAIWLNDDVMLVTVGFDQGSVTRGGNVYYYNVKTGDYRMIIKASGINGAEFDYMEINGDYLELGTCAFSYAASFYFRYTQKVPLSQVYDLISNNDLLILECVEVN